MEVPDYLSCLLRNLFVGQEAAIRSKHGTMESFKPGKEYNKAVDRHPAYLTCMQSASYKMPGWMKHKLESRLPGETATISDM